MNYGPNDFRQEYKDFLYSRDCNPQVLDTGTLFFDEMNCVLRENGAEFRIGPMLLPDGKTMPFHGAMGIYRTTDDQQKYFDGDEGGGRPLVKRDNPCYKVNLEQALDMFGD